MINGDPNEEILHKEVHFKSHEEDPNNEKCDKI